jgi:hypothetical protein
MASTPHGRIGTMMTMRDGERLAAHERIQLLLDALGNVTDTILDQARRNADIPELRSGDLDDVGEPRNPAAEVLRSLDYDLAGRIAAARDAIVNLKLGIGPDTDRSGVNP